MNISNPAENIDSLLHNAIRMYQDITPIVLNKNNSKLLLEKYDLFTSLKICVLYDNHEALNAIFSNFNIDEIKNYKKSPSSTFSYLFVGAITRNCSKHKNNGLEIINTIWCYAKEEINLHIEDDYCFKKALASNNKNMINYLIFDCNIEKTPTITYAINNLENFQEYNALFEKRDTYHKLNKDLTITENKKDKNKL